MVLRNVAKTFSLEEQRQEINEIAVDLDAVNTTLTNWNATQWDTAYGWGDHAQAGYWVDNSTSRTNWDTAYGWGNHSTAGYLTAEADTLDTVTGRGGTTTNTIQVGQINIGTGSAEINAQGNATFAGITQSSFLVNTNNTPTAGEGIEMFYDASASGGAAGGIQAYDRDSNALTRLKIRSSNWEIENNGSATFAGGNFAIGGTGAIAIDRADGGNFIIEGKLNNSQTSLIKADGSAAFGDASNSTGNNGVLVGGNNGSLNIYTERYTTDCFQILNTTGSGTNIALKAYGNGDLEIAGIIQTNTKSAGNVELDSTGAFTDSPLKLYASTGNIELDNPNGDTSLSIGDKTNSSGRLVLTSKSNTVEIHSRSNHPIEFLFNTTTKTKMTVDGGFNFEASGAGIVFDWQTQASGATSDKLDHYEEGTWTPVWGSTTGQITNITYNVQSGWYTRIGRVVYVHCRLRSTATDTSGAGGGLLVAGLPFVARTPQGTGGAAAYSGIDFPDSSVHVVTETRENTSQFYAGIYTLDNGAFGNIGPGSLQSSGQSEIRVSFFYMTDT